MAHLCCVASFLLFFSFSPSSLPSGVHFTRRVADYCFHRRDGHFLFPLLSDVFRLFAASAFSFFTLPRQSPSLPFAAMASALLKLLTQRCLLRGLQPALLRSFLLSTPLLFFPPTQLSSSASMGKHMTPAVVAEVETEARKKGATPRKTFLAVKKKLIPDAHHLQMPKKEGQAIGRVHGN